jgi:hypothetical protein
MYAYRKQTGLSVGSAAAQAAESMRTELNEALGQGALA